MSVALVQGVGDLLQRSLDPQQHRQAEDAIRQTEHSPGFSIALLQIVGNGTVSLTTRLAAALYFKNLVKRKWTDEEGNYKLPEDEVSQIKHDIVGLMISTPPAIQAQLGDAITIIAESDFWERWDTLMADLASRLAPTDPVLSNGVLQVAHAIFKRWHALYRTDALFTEINHVSDNFCQAFLSLLQSTDSSIGQNQSDQTALRQHMAVLNTSLKVIHDLSSHDLPQVLVDSLAGLIALLQKYLQYDNNLLQTNDESESGPLEFVKSEIFGILTLYATKYEEDVDQHIAPFMQSSWNLLTTVGLEMKYDIMASRALNFLTRVTGMKKHASNFNDQTIMTQVVEKVILPNISLRESDVELFEDEPIEYIRRDLEGTDSETRRRAATDFLRQLMQQFQELVTTVTMQYVTHFMQEYSQDSKSKWKSKDTAVYLFCSIAAEGTVTSHAGVKSVNPRVDIIEFFQSNIAQDLTTDTGHAILQVDAIKYLYVFRSQIKREQWQEAFPLLVKHLGSSNYVVHTYCAIAIERILALTDEERNEPIIPRESVLPLSKEMLRQLLTLITKDRTPEKIQENEFLMRCIMRILIFSRDGTLPHLDFILAGLTNITRLIRHNPSNPRFYYYLFESLGALIKFVGPHQPQKLETELSKTFGDILTESVPEFNPYVLQLLAALLEANQSVPLSPYFASLIPPVLHPSIWEDRGTIPALTRLLSAFVTRGPSHILQSNQLEPVLGIFQKLLASKVHDVHAFDLLETLILSLPHEALQPYYQRIFNLLLTRLSTSKTEHLTLRFVYLYHFMSARPPPSPQNLGADAVAAVLDSIQAGVYTQVYMSVILPETQKLQRPHERKTAVVSLAKALTDSTAFAEKYAKGWGYTCEALLKLMINPPVPSKDDGVDVADQDADDMEFGVGFTALGTVKKGVRDSFPETGADLKAWLGEWLRRRDQETGGRIAGFVGSRLSEETRGVLVSYMQG